MLLAAGAAVDCIDNAGITPLWMASQDGHASVVSALLAAGAAVDCTDKDGTTPLCIASQEGHASVVSALLASGAAVDFTEDNHGRTPLAYACRSGCLETVQILSSFGASRTCCTTIALLTSAEELTAFFGHGSVAAWLTSSRLWSTPLHHLAIISSERARTLLRSGADVHAAEVAGPTPLSLAQAVRAKGALSDGSPADLVLKAAGPWSPHTHALFPAASRERAVVLMRIGWRLSRTPRYEAIAVGFFDLWMEGIVSRAVERIVQL
jgi:ankyrin repeat protein